MTAMTYKKYCEKHEDVDRDIPVMFKTMQGAFLLKVLEISQNDDVPRWGKLGPLQKGMVAGRDYY